MPLARRAEIFSFGTRACGVSTQAVLRRDFDHRTSILSAYGLRPKPTYARHGRSNRKVRLAGEVIRHAPRSPRGTIRLDALGACDVLAHVIPGSPGHRASICRLTVCDLSRPTALQIVTHTSPPTGANRISNRATLYIRNGRGSYLTCPARNSLPALDHPIPCAKESKNRAGAITRSRDVGSTGRESSTRRL